MPVVSGTSTGGAGAVCGDWTTADALCGDLTGVGDEAKANAIRAASWVLWSLTGRRYGVCPVTWRPCPTSRRRPPPARSFFGPDWSMTGLAVPRPVAGCYCTGPCSCSRGRASNRLVIPELLRPARSIIEVTVDGVVLEETAYRLANRRTLIRLDGDTWPLTQDLDLDLSEPGTFGFRFERGVPVPQIGITATNKLGGELARACSGKKCQLPERVTTVVRQGFTMSMLDPMDFLEKGKTGLYEVDLFLGTANPGGLRRRSRVIDARDRV